MTDEMNLRTSPLALTIAGSDNSAGAGIQADLKTFTAHGVYGLTAVTCVVAEIPGAVEGIAPVPLDVVKAQIRLSLEAYPVRALKTGMLFSAEIVEAVCDSFDEAPGLPPLVVDPVMIATSGDPLIREEAIALYRTRLLPMAALITPNLDEVRALLGRAVEDLDGMKAAGQELVQQFGAACLVKGGHLRGGEAIDLLVTGSDLYEFRAPFVKGVSTHGTGCTYSAAIAANLAKAIALPEAVSAAKDYITRAIGEHLFWEEKGRRIDALDHDWKNRRRQADESRIRLNC